MPQRKIDSLKVEFQNKVSALGDAKVLEKIKENFELQYAFESVNFDGTNKVSARDSKKILGGEVPKKYEKREVREIINHYSAFMRMTEMASNKKEFNEEVLKDFHEVLTDDIIPGGVYRNVNIQLPGYPKQPPHFEKVYDRMDVYFETLKKNDFKNVIEKAAYAHQELHKIHPFLDANGRLSRLVMNYFLVSSGYLPVSICKKSLKKYFGAIDKYKESKDLKPFVDLLVSLLEKRYKKEIAKL